ncbi:M12 family metallo-peptidase [Marinicella sp. W31]|uniref:M12 family metallo-peptidase n=1 Tax=Marinicella sp. W31 TaxID=3023713 RepID=UPI0037567F3A
MKHVVTFLFLWTFSLAAEAQLFSATSVERQSLAATEYNAMTATINGNLLRNKTAEFDVDLPNGTKTTAVFSRLKSYSNNRYSWFGHIKSHPDEQIIISQTKGAYAGAIYSHSGTFEIQPMKAGQVRVVELNSEAFPDCEAGEVPPNSTVEQQKHSPTIQAPTRGGTVDFDVVVVYTPEARDGAGGVAQIEATALAAVDAMNLSMSNSLVDAEANLSYTGLVGYNDSGDSSTDLNWVRTSSQVGTIRTAFGGDMVSLLVQTMGGCGRGYVMRNPGPGFASSAVQVTRRSCAVGNLSFAHEFGHNLGLEHNPEDSSATSATASNPWSFGQYHSGAYRTVMSYSNPCTGGCTRRQYFSNPDVQFMSLDTGVANTKDNARTLRQTTPIAAAFRPAANDIIFENSYE